ncbi:MAG: DUF6049 family protein [Actinomycetales bacterium]
MSRARRRLAALCAAGLALICLGSSVAYADPSGTATGTSGGPTASPTATNGPPKSSSSSRSSSQSQRSSISQTGDDPDMPASITVKTLSPAVVTPTSTLTIKGTVTNDGDSAIQNGVIRLLVHHAPLATRDQVGQWANGDISDVGGRILDASMDLSVTLRPGAGIAFTLKAPADRLGLFMDFASIGITLEVLGDDGTALGTHRVGLLRSFITWQQNPSYSPLKLTWLMPLSGGPTSAIGGPPDAATLAAALAPGGRFQDLLAAISAAPRGAGLSVAVDPAFVNDLRVRAAQPSRTAGSSPSANGTPSGSASPSGSPISTPTTTSAQQTIASYLAALKVALAGHRVVRLPYGDPDLMGVADAKGTALLSAATFAATTASPAAPALADELGVRVIDDVAWPAGGLADTATVNAAPAVGATTLVLSASSRPPTLEQSTTPTGVTPVNATTNAVLYDDLLSAFLAGTNNATTMVLNTQRFLAETLATVYENPTRQRTLLVTAPRSFNPNPLAVQRLFAALAQAQWIAPASLTGLRRSQGQATVSVRDVVPVPANARRLQVTTAQVDAVRDARSEAAQLGDVITGEDPFTRTRVDALRLVSAYWRGRGGTAAVQVKGLRSYLAAQGARVHILPLSNLNFLASDGNLTLSVANDLGQDVRGVRVVVQPGNGRLIVVKQAAPIAVEADRRTTIKVHVRAVAGGIVPVTARILTPDGLQMGKAVTVRVHVRPTDTWAFWVLGVAAALIFLIGLVRTIRRGRARPRLMAPEVEEP